MKFQEKLKTLEILMPSFSNPLLKNTLKARSQKKAKNETSERVKIVKKTSGGMQISTISLFFLDVEKNIEKTAPVAPLGLPGSLQGSPEGAERVQKGVQKMFHGRSGRC